MRRPFRPRALRPALATLLAATLAACGGEGLPTTPARPDAAPGATSAASYALALGARATDAAALVRLSGAGIDSVTAAAGVALAEVGRDADGVRVVLHGALDAGTVATVWVRAGAARPALAVEQVSDARTFALGDPGALRATLVAR